MPNVYTEASGVVPLTPKSLVTPTYLSYVRIVERACPRELQLERLNQAYDVESGAVVWTRIYSSAHERQ